MSPSGVPVTVEADARATPDAAFHAIAPIELPRIFRGFGPLPGVVGTREQTGQWDHVGATRVVELADGSEAQEQITVYDAPSHFAYRLGEFTSPLRLVVHHADGAWWFSDGPADWTNVRWTYTFQPRKLAGPLIRIALAPVWRAYASRALALAIQEAERSHNP